MKSCMLLVFIFVMTGCMPEYKIPDNTHKTSTLIMHTYAKAEDTNTFYINIDNSYVNNVNQGAMGQKTIAHLTTNHAAATKVIKAGDKFRILVRQVKMYGILGSVCDTVVAFYPKNGLSYVIDAYSNMDSMKQNRCSVKLFKMVSGNKSAISPVEYSVVSN